MTLTKRSAPASAMARRAPSFTMISRSSASSLYGTAPTREVNSEARDPDSGLESAGGGSAVVVEELAAERTTRRTRERDTRAENLRTVPRGMETPSRADMTRAFRGARGMV